MTMQATHTTQTTRAVSPAKPGHRSGVRWAGFGAALVLAMSGIAINGTTVSGPTADDRPPADITANP
jgi:hypothetical protein